MISWPWLNVFIGSTTFIEHFFNRHKRFSSWTGFVVNHRKKNKFGLAANVCFKSDNLYTPHSHKFQSRLTLLCMAQRLWAWHFNFDDRCVLLSSPPPHVKIKPYKIIKRKKKIRHDIPSISVKSKKRKYYVTSLFNIPMTLALRLPWYVTNSSRQHRKIKLGARKGWTQLDASLHFIKYQAAPLCHRLLSSIPLCGTF